MPTPMTPEIEAIYIQLALKNKEAFERYVAEVAAKVKKYSAEMKADLGTVGQGLKDAGYNKGGVDDAVNSLKKIEPAADSATKGLFGLKNIARTALGTLTAMSIFLVTQFVGQALAKAIDGVRQLELSIIKLRVAEESLSKAGVDITPQDFTDITKEIQKTYSFISEIDSQKLIADLAVLTKDLKLTKEQLRDLALAVPGRALLANKSIENIAGQVATGITKSGKGWADWGIQVNAGVIKQKAINMQLVASEEAFNNLTEAQKQQVEVQALLQILNESNVEVMKQLGVYTGTIDEKTRSLAGTWEDFTTKFGKLVSPAYKAGLEIIITSLQGWEDILTRINRVWNVLYAGIASGLLTINQVLQGNIKSLDEYVKYQEAAYKATLYFLSESTNSNFSPDTPTGAGQTIPSTEPAEEEKLQDALDKAREEILQAQQKLEQDLVDAEIDLQRKLQDIDIEYLGKRKEAWIDYQEKVADINRDYNDKIADINRDYNDTVSEIQQEAATRAQENRNDALQKEAEFQNRLLEMREDFLMSLEDALHARDARQVLKLIANYDLDKQQAERKHALDMQEDANSAKIEAQKVKREIQHAQERRARAIAEAEEDRKRKLADAKLDYQQKMAQLKRQEDAERTAARLADKRKREDLIRGMKDRLAIMAADLVSQYNLTKKGLDAVLKLFQAYYGDKGYLSQVLAGMQNRLVASTTPNFGGTWAGAGSVRPMTTTRSGERGFAEGGTMIANKPTKVTFGEGGLEMATFIPLAKRGSNVNQVFSNLGGQSGKLAVELLLSPDLEGRIVENTLDVTASIIQRVQRSK